MNTLVWLPSLIINFFRAWLLPRALFVRTYSPSSDITRTYEESARNDLRYLDYKAKRLLYK